MKPIIKIVMAITLLLSFAVSKSQIKNDKTETVKIFRNCAICETTIEKAGSIKKIANVDWNKDTKMATLYYETKMEMAGMKMSKDSAVAEKQETNQLKSVFDNYFLLKDALVKTNGETASVKANGLLIAVNSVKKETLKMDVQMV
jgi:hypothetical protein